MRTAYRLLPLLIFFLVNASRVKAEVNYDFSSPTKKLAFVVGNGDYEAIDKLPAAPQEADKIASTLHDLGFDVSNARNVTYNEFNGKLNEFVNKIGEDDFVVFYFSGHGFSYKSNNYLVPIRFPDHVSEVEVPITFISVATLRNRLAKRDHQPGHVLLLLDACRAAAQFDSLKAAFEDGADRVQPGWIRPQVESQMAQRVSYEFLYASNPGFTVNSGATPGPFALALSENLPHLDKAFSQSETDIITYVKVKTALAQVPWSDGSPSAEVFFNPSNSIIDQLHTSWQSVLSKPDVESVAAFRYKHSVGPYTKASRDWLSNNGGIIFASLTRISPLAPEIGWANFQAEDNRPITLLRFEGPLAFTRDIRLTAPNVDTITKPEVLTTANAFPPSALEVAELFAKHGKAVVTGPIPAFDQPASGATLVSELKTGTPLEVLGAETSKNNDSWLKVRVPGEAPAFVQLPRTPIVATTNIGKPLMEIVVSGIRGQLEDLVDIQPAIKSVADLTAAGRSIEWISISTPKANNQRDRDLFILRVAFSKYMLSMAGISRQRISVVAGDETLPHDNIRLRVFGN